MSSYTELVSTIRKEPIAEVIVFDGYSGLGYAYPEKIKHSMYDEIKAKLISLRDLSGFDNLPLYVVAGATADGIGMCYDVADRLVSEGYNVQKVGIVSSAATVVESWGKALPDEQAARLEHLVIVEDPDRTWQVLNKHGKSLMVDIGFATGKPTKFSFYGGGGVANAELEELQDRLSSHPCWEVSVEIRHGSGDIAPKADKAEKKYNQVLEKKLAKGLSQDAAIEAASLEVNGTKNYTEGFTVGKVDRVSKEPGLSI